MRPLPRQPPPRSIEGLSGRPAKSPPKDRTATHLYHLDRLSRSDAQYAYKAHSRNTYESEPCRTANERANGNSIQVGPWKINVQKWGPIQESTWTPSPTKVIHLTVIGASRVFIFFRYPVAPAARIRIRRRRFATFCTKLVAARCNQEARTGAVQLEVQTVRCCQW